jgi:hypothetical protein
VRRHQYVDSGRLLRPDGAWGAGSARGCNTLTPVQDAAIFCVIATSGAPSAAVLRLSLALAPTASEASRRPAVQPEEALARAAGAAAAAGRAHACHGVTLMRASEPAD